MKKGIDIGAIIQKILLAFGFTLIVAIVIVFALGYRPYLVNGWSSEPAISYQSLVLDTKTSLEDLEIGDYITFSLGGKSYVTHQIIAIKTDGYFEAGSTYTAYLDGDLNGETVEFEFGKGLDPDNTSSNLPNMHAQSNCNIITQQTSSKYASYDTINYQQHFKGKVQVVLPVTGKIIFFVRNNFIQIIVYAIILWIGSEFLRFTPDYQQIF